MKIFQRATNLFLASNGLTIHHLFRDFGNRKWTFCRRLRLEFEESLSNFFDSVMSIVFSTLRDDRGDVAFVGLFAFWFITTGSWTARISTVRSQIIWVINTVQASLSRWKWTNRSKDLSIVPRLVARAEFSGNQSSLFIGRSNALIVIKIVKINQSTTLLPVISFGSGGGGPVGEGQATCQCVAAGPLCFFLRGPEKKK